MRVNYQAKMTYAVRYSLPDVSPFNHQEEDMRYDDFRFSNSIETGYH